MTDTLKAQLEQWLADGYTSVNETPLDDYGLEVVREVLALLDAAPQVGTPAVGSGGQPRAEVQGALLTDTTRTVFTAEDFEHLANSMEWPEDFRALSQAAAQARVIEKLKAWLPTLREQPGIPTVGQIERRLADLLTEEGLTP